MSHKSNRTFLLRLRDTSRECSAKFESFFDWGKYAREGGLYYLPPELVSLYGTSLYEMLSPAQIREIGRLEAIQIIYLYAYTESVMCLYLARHLVGSDFGSEEHAFLLREQIEEYRHQDMFLRGLEILGRDFEPMSKWTKWWTGFEALILPKRYFFLLQITIELISREVGKICFQDPSVHPLVRDLCLMHEREEALHIAFSEQYIARYFADAGFIARTIGGICIALDIAFINHFYISPAIYQKAGIKEYKEAYEIARKSIKINPTKNMLTGKARDFLLRYNWITWGNVWVFRLITGITSEKLAKKD